MANGNGVLGGGRLYLRKEGEQGHHFVTGVRPGMAFNTTTQKAERFTYTGKLASRAYTGLTSVSRGMTFESDDHSEDQLSYYFLGERLVVNQTASSSDKTETFTGLRPGQSIILGQSEQNPSGVMNVAVTSISKNGTPLSAGEDFVTFSRHGRVAFMDGVITGEDDEFVAVYGNIGHKRTRIISGETPFIGAIRFEEELEVGEPRIWTAPLAKIYPDGDFTLIGDNAFTSYRFTVDLLKKGDLPELMCDGMPVNL